MPILENKRKDTTNPRSAFLRRFRENKYSQCGEDGVVAKIIEILGDDIDHTCVEFGAWDGKLFSNTWNLLVNHGWKGLLLEPNPVKYLDLLDNAAAHSNIIALNKSVGLNAETGLDHILSTSDLPQSFGLLSIDIDGNDYHAWKAINRYRPSIVIIEFNPTIPNDVVFIQDCDPRINQGCSLSALIGLASDKGYELIATTGWNAFFVVRELYERIGIQDNSIEAIHNDNELQTKIFQLFDGTFVMSGYLRMFWHGLPIDPLAFQPLPKGLRVFPDSKVSYSRFDHDDLSLPYVYRDWAISDDRPIAILLHGAHQRISTVMPLARALVGRLPVAIPVLRGHNQRGSTCPPLSLKDLAGDVVALMNAIGSRAYVLLGHSLGALVAAAAAKSDDRVKAVLAIDPPMQLKELKSVEEYLLANMHLPLCERLYTDLFYPGGEGVDFREVFQQLRIPTVLAVAGRGIRSRDGRYDAERYTSDEAIQVLKHNSNILIKKYNDSDHLSILSEAHGLVDLSLDHAELGY